MTCRIHGGITGTHAGGFPEIGGFRNSRKQNSRGILRVLPRAISMQITSIHGSSHGGPRRRPAVKRMFSTIEKRVVSSAMKINWVAMTIVYWSWRVCIRRKITANSLRRRQAAASYYNFFGVFSVLRSILSTRGILPCIHVYPGHEAKQNTETECESGEKYEAFRIRPVARKRFYPARYLQWIFRGKKQEEHRRRSARENCAV